MHIILENLGIFYMQIFIRAIRVVNNSSFKAHSDPIFFRLELLNFDDTYKLGVLSLSLIHI